MLRARPWSRRIAFKPWTANHECRRRFSSDWDEFSSDNGSERAPRKYSQRRERNIDNGGATGRDNVRRDDRGRGKSRDAQKERNSVEAVRDKEEPTTPSLAEQLFPEETKRYAEAQRKLREVPRLPLDKLEVPKPIHPLKPPPKPDGPMRSWAAQRLENTMRAAGPGTSILVLRNATPNLTEEDFRRLVPQGKHIEGWTLEQGDIIKVIPGRNLQDLSPQNVYYLLFSSALSAFSYQGQVTRIHTLTSQHTPSSMTAPMPPPPGYMIEGLDVHAAIEAYALVPPGQKLEMRQLKPPLTPAMQLLVKHRGYPDIVNRENKMPFEARLTLEGPQLALSAVRHEIMSDGKKRGLSWSGEDSNSIDISRWEGERWISPMDDNSRLTRSQMAKWDEVDVSEPTMAAGHETNSNDSGISQQKRRTPGVVYIVGFRTERAAQSFVQYWHRRPIGSPKHHDIEGDIPPIANVDLLW